MWFSVGIEDVEESVFSSLGPVFLRAYLRCSATPRRKVFSYDWR
jgi:hypothetical protein